MAKLCVNVDHVATVREARKTYEPDPAAAAVLCERAGADGITVHLREDRRHIHDQDVRRLKKRVRTKLNLEMSVAPGIVRIACRVKPDQATLVPEKRREVTTEGGLDVVKNFRRVKQVTAALRKKRITVSLFINPDRKQIAAARSAGAEFIELHTGEYANARPGKARARELARLTEAARFAKATGLRVNAGHGLNYENVKPVARLPGVEELNIGHSIVSRAVMAGMERAVREMKRLVG